MVAPEVAPMSYPNNKPPKAGKRNLKIAGTELNLGNDLFIFSEKHIRTKTSVTYYFLIHPTLFYNFFKYYSCFQTKTKTE